jgi:hypothetical protein
MNFGPRQKNIWKGQHFGCSAASAFVRTVNMVVKFIQ